MPAAPQPEIRRLGRESSDESGVPRVLVLRQEEGVQQRVHLQQRCAVQHQPVAFNRQQSAMPQIFDLLVEALEHIHAELLPEIRDRHPAEL